METPNTRAGHLTEKVMASIKHRLVMSTHQYNAVYCGVLRALEAEFGATDCTPTLDPKYISQDIIKKVLGDK